jgi:rhamnogalacturonyl hydrolase YesR
MKSRFCLLATCLLAMAAGMPATRGALLAYEPFTNASGTAIIGTADGFGFSAAWQANSSSGVATNTGYGFSYTDAAGNTLVTAGGAGFFQGLTTATAAMQPTRYFTFASGTNGTDGTTTWISFLVVRQGPAVSGSNPYPRGANVCHDINTGAIQKLAVGNSTSAATNTVAFIPQGSGASIKPSAIVFSQTNFVVVRINHNSSALDDAHLFVNPSLSAEPSVSSANTNSIGTFDYSFDRLRIFVGGNTSSSVPYGELVLDEYRIGETFADVAPYTSNATTNPPSITSQPANLSVVVGSNATFTVAASGSQPLRYQWYFNTNTLLTGATNSTVTVSNVQFTNAGGYSVVITNHNGAITSVVATLTVSNALAPSITTPPTSQTVAAGASPVLTVAANGSAPLRYQWYFNTNTALARATNTSLTVYNIRTNDAGSYSVTVSNIGGVVTSSYALVTVTGAPASTLPDRAAIIEVIRRVNNYFIANNTLGANNWQRSAYQDGNMRVYQVLGDANYLNWAVRWGTNNNWNVAVRSPTNSNDYACGQTYVDLYRIDPQPVRIAAVQAAIDNRVANPADAINDWDWIDAFFMGAPVFARFGSLYATNSYFDMMWQMYDDMKNRQGLFDYTDQLWYRDALAKTAVTANGQKQYWGRGEGWVMGGLVRVLEQMPANYAHRDEFIGNLQAMAAGLAPWQQADGMWRSSIVDPAEVPNPETSGTGFFIYGYAWGIRNGFLNRAEYLDLVARAWNGTVATAVHANGFLGYVQQGAAAPGPSTYNTTFDYGVGAFLLGGAEVLLLVDMPVITLQPQNQSSPTGSNAIFSITATGAAPLGYQWYFGGNPIANATNATLIRSNVQPADLGVYSVTVSNYAGIAASSQVILTNSNTAPVAGPDVFARGKDLSLKILKAALLTNDTDADGNPLTLSGIDLTTTNGVTLATDATFIFYTNSLNVTDRFSYTITDGFGGYATGTVVITVIAHVAGQVLNVALSATAATLGFAGIPGYVYEVQRSTNLVDWVVISTNAVPGNGLFGLVDTFAGLGGPPPLAFYRLRFVTSDTLLTITTQPQSLAAMQNQSVAFSVTATGTPTPMYQWYFNGTILSGQTGATLTRNNVQTSQAGNYTVVLNNGFGSTTSSVAVLSVLVPPAITTQPQSLTVTQGQNATFAVAASGSAPLSYQWRLNGSSIGNATNASLTLSNVQISAAGNYSVVITNMAGAITSSVVTLTVLSPPTITTQPQSQTVAAGLNVTFLVTVTGNTPLRYQWYFNTNTPLANATNASVTLTNLQSTNAGGYSVVATNSYGAATSAVATLTVDSPLVPGAYFVSVTNGNDSNPGTEASPYKTISKGLSKITSGGVVYVRAGTYALSSKLSLSGTSASAANRIRLWAYPGERPIIDSTGNSSDGIGISGDFYHLKGLEQKLAGHNGINISGDSNIVEFCSVHDNGNTGLHLTGSSAPGPAGNLILNCDSYLNYDPPIGGNADGFSAKWDVGPGNVFRGCRSWWNSDDGWDLWMGTSAVLIADCWAFYNGTNYWNDPQFNGNGQGFKLGGNYVGAPHRLLRSVAFKNEACGVDQNNNLDGQTVDNNTCWGNKSRNFNLNHGTNGTPHIVRNNISFAGASSDSFRSGTLFTNNSWQVISPAPNASDFQSLDESVATGPRQADGSLPVWPFLRPVNGGRLVDQGVDIGEPFNGTAPDLGAYETP